MVPAEILLVLPTAFVKVLFILIAWQYSAIAQQCSSKGDHGHRSARHAAVELAAELTEYDATALLQLPSAALSRIGAEVRTGVMKSCPCEESDKAAQDVLWASPAADAFPCDCAESAMPKVKWIPPTEDVEAASRKPKVKWIAQTEGSGLTIARRHMPKVKWVAPVERQRIAREIVWVANDKPKVKWITPREEYGVAINIPTVKARTHEATEPEHAHEISYTFGKEATPHETYRATYSNQVVAECGGLGNAPCNSEPQPEIVVHGNVNVHIGKEGPLRHNVPKKETDNQSPCHQFGLHEPPSASRGGSGCQEGSGVAVEAGAPEGNPESAWQSVESAPIGTHPGDNVYADHTGIIVEGYRGGYDTATTTETYAIPVNTGIKVISELTTAPPSVTRTWTEIVNVSNSSVRNNSAMS